MNRLGIVIPTLQEQAAEACEWGLQLATQCLEETTHAAVELKESQHQDKKFVLVVHLQHP